MAVNTPFYTIAAAVATIGAFCGFDSHHANPHEDNGRHRPESCGEGEQVVKSKEWHGRANRNPAFAPQFDGLHCYETLIINH